MIQAAAGDASGISVSAERLQSLGNVPAELCNAMAGLYDSGDLVFDNAFVSFADPVTKRNRHAKQAVLFVEVHAVLIDSDNKHS